MTSSRGEAWWGVYAESVDDSASGFKEADVSLIDEHKNVTVTLTHDKYAEFHEEFTKEYGTDTWGNFDELYDHLLSRGKMVEAIADPFADLMESL